jgi:hypothetical protein
MTHRSEYWEDRDGFDHNSRELVCSITGIPYKGKVYRGPNIMDEGYFDISQYAAEDLARHIGWVAPETHAAVETGLAEAQAERDAYAKEVSSLRDQVRALTLANAELYSQFEDEDEDE